MALLGALEAVLPVSTALAMGNEQRIDRQALARMSGAQRLRVILVAADSLNFLEGEVHRLGIAHPLRVPIAHGISAELTPAQIRYLSGRPEVVRVVYDAPVRLADTTFDPVQLATAYPSAVDAVSQWSNGVAPLTGNGIGVAVIDSGIAAHPDLGNRVVVNKDFNPNVSDATDAYGHGTAVAGIIAGDGTASNGQYIGVAPQASLVNLRVNDGSGAAPTSTIMNAILWAVENRSVYNIRILNLSLSASVQESYMTSPIDAAVEYAWLKGIVVVVAAGNNGPNSALYAPANDPFVITVGATDDQGTRLIGDDTLAAFSSYGLTQDGVSKPELVAPGRHIVTTLAANSSFALNYPTYIVGSQYIRLSGTSMAAPMVSGVAALYIESHPQVRPGQLKALLISTAQPLPLVGAGAGYPDAARAVAYQGLVGNANHGIDPNNFLKVMYLQARNLQTLPSVSWDSVSWDSVSWDSVSWDSIAWNAVSWAS
ncbi:MAG TPA: S8 family serine peptidase [Candidatus Dormibacteraeota bacterium]|nr:S8 family serine peptidase [Candidatus Dormibacteraeota bacterium]